MRQTCLLLCLASTCLAQNAQRLNYLDENNPYYPGLKFPKLITPQWVGEEGVDAVIILGIDDMRDTAKYEQYLRPILTRLKKIDGRAPVSIMTNKVKPEDPQLQSWLDEGLSLECHTVDHPCPLLKDGDFDKAKSTYERCIDLMASIPRNKPVAFRMPCCDSLNTVSPRFFSEIFNKTTENKNHLTIDTSVFQFFTSDDPDIPRELIIDADGQDKFLKYMPKDRGFVNYIENYPYPYVINKLCWEFPCVAPSDWSAQHKHGVNNQVTVDDWKAAIDITVVKKGVFCLVFHPHGWIKPEQIVELIDHAEEKHGKKVKFLTFKEASRRLDENFLRGREMRPVKSQYMRYEIEPERDYVGITFEGARKGEWPDIWRWEDRDGEWARSVGENSRWKEMSTTAKQRWVHGPPTGGSGAGYPYFTKADQRNIEKQPLELDTFGFLTNVEPGNNDSDPFFDLEEKLPPSVLNRVRAIAKKDPRTKLLNGDGAGVLVDHVIGLRIFDLNDDGFRDVVYSDAERYGVFLFDESRKGWTTTIVDRKRGPEPVAGELLPIANADFTDNGFFIHGDAMYWQNENTAKEPHLVVKRTFAEILAAGKKVGWAPPNKTDNVASAEASGKAPATRTLGLRAPSTSDGPTPSSRANNGDPQSSPKSNQHPPSLGLGGPKYGPESKSPQASLKCIDVREGFKVELVAAEPLIHDPIAFDWLPDGRMIVVEMGGYPNGVDDNKTAQRTRLRPSVGQPQQSPRAANANGVAQQSPASRSARWVTDANRSPYPNGVPQNEPTTGVEPLRGTRRLNDDVPGVRFATPGFDVERPWRSAARVDENDTPPGLPRWFTGLCATDDPDDIQSQVAQRPTSHRDKPGGGTPHVGEPCCGKVAEPRHAIASGFNPRYINQQGPQVAERRQVAEPQTNVLPAAAPRLTYAVRTSFLGLKPEAITYRRSTTDARTADRGPRSATSVGSAVRTKTNFTTDEPVRAADPTNGRVRILEDTNNDGVYDKARTFLDGLNFPTGVMPWKNGVLISAAPDIIYAEDTNGDGKADKREVLFTGFTEGNQQHRVNGFESGLDNWVYVANGDSGGTIKSIKTGKTLDIRSNDIRIKPDTGEMERVTGRTQFGRHRDAYGNWFGCNNSNPMWHYVLDEKYISRNKHFAPGSLKHVVPEVPGNAPIFPISTTPERFNDFHTANRFTSACSTIVYNDDLFGPHFKRNAFICEPVHNLISRLVLEPNGVTFTGKRAPDEQDREFLASTDNWFRPVFVRTGPDGALWIADMYRHVIEHPEWIPDDWRKKLDLRAGHDKGRIYRVVPVTAKSMKELASFPIKGEAKELNNPNRWVRDTVQRKLVNNRSVAGTEPTDKTNAATLRRLAKEAQIPVVRLQALSTLHRNDITHELGIAALKDKDPDVRRHAIRRRQMEGRDGEVRKALDQIVELAKDPADEELLELAYAFGIYNGPVSAESLAGLFKKRPNDRYVRTAILSSASESNMPRLLKFAVDPDTPLDFARTVFDIAIRSKNPKLLKAGLEAIGDPGVLKDLRSKERAVVLAAAVFRTMDPSGKFLKGNPLSQEAQKTYEQLVRVVQTASADRLCEKHSPTLVAASIEVFGFIMRGKGSKFEAGTPEQNARLLSVSIPQPVQFAVVDDAARFSGIEPASFFLGTWKNVTPALRSRMFGHLLADVEQTSELLIWLTDGRLKPSDLDAAQRSLLTSHREKWIREKATELFGSTKSSDRKAIVTRFQDIKPGDAIAGRAVFEKRCATCHQLGGVGKQIGADLTGLKDKSTKALLAAILDPNRAVETKFVSYTALTEEGKTFSGMIKSESGNAITLIGSDGKEQTVLRSDIEEFSCSNKSLMPEGLEKDLTEQDLANVIAFVQSGTGAGKPKTFAGNTPAIVRPDASGSLRLTARNCRIHGPNLVYESHFGNLGHWASSDDYAVWQIEGLKAGSYRILATTAVPENLANQKFHVEVGSAKVEGSVPSSNGWNYYKQFEVGTVEVAADASSVRVRASGKVNQYLMDLRELLFEPVR